MTIMIERNNKNISIFFWNPIKRSKWLWDFKKFLISSWKKEKENISENIDNFIYK